MKRFACLYLPRWPVQRLIVERQDLRNRPVLLHRRDPRRGERVVFCSGAALQAGVRIDMPVTEAVALIGATTPPVKLPYDPAADRAALGRLAEYCERFSPTVGWDTLAPRKEPPWFGDTPPHLFLDVTGVAHLFGGEAPLLERMVGGCEQAGYFVRAVISETLGASWAVALCTNHSTIVPTGMVGQMLAPLPIAGLRVSEEVLTTLERLGVTSITQLQQLPRDGLAGRFGSILLWRLDQALGHAPEAIVPHRPLPGFTTSFALELPTGRREWLDWLIGQLLERLGDEMRRHGVGATKLRGELRCEDVREPVALEVGLFRPSASAERLCDMLRLQLDRLRLPGPVTHIRLWAEQTAPLTPCQEELFADDTTSAGPHMTALVERLSSRLGADAVVCPVGQADALPERGYRYVPVVEARGRLNGLTAPAVADRPLCLFAPPPRIEAIALAPDGPPISFVWQHERHVVKQRWGPERIETGWWRGRTARRDYYRVETARGERYWLYRDLQDGGWRLHGWFG